MSYTAEQIAALEEAIASGALEVKYKDRWVRYQDLAEMRRTLAAMRDEVAGTPSTQRRKYASFDKGLES